jgi:hypothetical protein
MSGLQGTTGPQADQLRQQPQRRRPRTLFGQCVFTLFVSELTGARRAAEAKAVAATAGGHDSSKKHFAKLLKLNSGDLHDYIQRRGGARMKKLVVYSSQTGNTRMLAQAAYEILTGSKEIHKIEDAPAPDGFERSALCGSFC